MNPELKLSATSKFAVLDLKNFKGDHVKKEASAKEAKEEQKRAELNRGTKEVGDRMASLGLIGGSFTPSTDPSRFSTRTDLFEQWFAAREAATASLPAREISITLPDGVVKTGLAFKTTPMDIAMSISKGLAEAVIIAKVAYSTRLDSDVIVACDDDQEEEHEEEEALEQTGELWDMGRPLVGDCNLSLLKFEDPEAKTVRDCLLCLPCISLSRLALHSFASLRFCCCCFHAPYGNTSFSLFNVCVRVHVTGSGDDGVFLNNDRSEWHGTAGNTACQPLTTVFFWSPVSK
jgi:hypothetical protein